MDDIYLNHQLKRAKWIDRYNQKPLPTVKRYLDTVVYEHRFEDNDWRINFINRTPAHPTIYPVGVRGIPTPRNINQAILAGG